MESHSNCTAGCSFGKYTGNGEVSAQIVHMICILCMYREACIYSKDSLQAMLYVCSMFEDATAHLQNSVYGHTCTNICNKNCTEAPVNMCICTEYGLAFINTFITTCKYCQYTVHADKMFHENGFANFPGL